MADGDSKELEQDFSDRNETLRSFYNTDSLEMSDAEIASLTPILNSLKDNVFRYHEIEDIGGGLIIEVGEKPLNAALITMTSKTTEELHEMGDKLYLYIQQNYTWNIITKKLISFFTDVVTKKKSL